MKNDWQKNMYGPEYVFTNIDNFKMHQQAEDEISFLATAIPFKPDSLVLDVACGGGRHLKAMSRFGLQLSGVDISEHCLNAARKNCPPDVKLFSGSMNDLSRFHGAFDLVTCFFTSFGFFETDEENFHVLREFYKCLRPGGTLVLQLIDHDWFQTVFSEISEFEVEDRKISEIRKYDSDRKTISTRISIHNTSTGKIETTGYRCRIFQKAEVESMLQNAGFSRIVIYGDALGNPYIPAVSKRPFYIARL